MRPATNSKTGRSELAKQAGAAEVLKLLGRLVRGAASTQGQSRSSPIRTKAPMADRSVPVRVDQPAIAQDDRSSPIRTSTPQMGKQAFLLPLARALLRTGGGAARGALGGFMSGAAHGAEALTARGGSPAMNLVRQAAGGALGAPVATAKGAIGGAYRGLMGRAPALRPRDAMLGPWGQPAVLDALKHLDISDVRRLLPTGSFGRGIATMGGGAAGLGGAGYLASQYGGDAVDTAGQGVSDAGSWIKRQLGFGHPTLARSLRQMKVSPWARA